MKCSLCGKESGSLYGQPGDKTALMCAQCFFPKPSFIKITGVYS